MRDINLHWSFWQDIHVMSACLHSIEYVRYQYDETLSWVIDYKHDLQIIILLAWPHAVKQYRIIHCYDIQILCIKITQCWWQLASVHNISIPRHKTAKMIYLQDNLFAWIPSSSLDLKQALKCTEKGRLCQRMQLWNTLHLFFSYENACAFKLVHTKYQRWN